MIPLPLPTRRALAPVVAGGTGPGLRGAQAAPATRTGRGVPLGGFYPTVPSATTKEFPSGKHRKRCQDTNEHSFKPRQKSVCFEVSALSVRCPLAVVDGSHKKRSTLQKNKEPYEPDANARGPIGVPVGGAWPVTPPIRLGHGPSLN